MHYNRYFYCKVYCNCHKIMHNTMYKYGSVKRSASKTKISRNAEIPWCKTQVLQTRYHCRNSGSFMVSWAEKAPNQLRLFSRTDADNAWSCAHVITSHACKPFIRGIDCISYVMAAAIHPPLMGLAQLSASHQAQGRKQQHNKLSGRQVWQRKKTQWKTLFILSLRIKKSY
jgi:hypothetical protein